MTVLVVVEGVVLLLLLVLVVGLLRSHAEILRRLHELGAGVYEEAPDTTQPIRTRPGVAEPRAEATAASDLAGVTPDGAARSITVLGAPHSTLLAFLSSGCATCSGFWQAFGAGAADDLPVDGTRLVVVTRGPEAESPAAVRDVAPRGLATIMSTEAFDAYEVPMYPYFILVDGPSGEVVGEGAATTWTQVNDLLRQAMADSSAVGPDREARVDAELRRAGIVPGHESLYPAGATEPPPQATEPPLQATEPPLQDGAA